MSHLHPALFLVTTLLILLLPHSSWCGYDYDTTTEDTGTPPQSSDNLCVESYNDNGFEKSRATACPEDTPYTKYYCAIYKKYGSPGHCIKSDECPSGVFDDKIVCQKDKDYCCCKNTPGRYPKDTLLACNDIENPKNDMIWKQFCSLREVKYDEYCLKGPKNKPGLKWNEMAPQCLDYCNEKRGTDYNGKPKTGGYSLRCNNRVEGQGKWNCPHPCPVGCDQYCEDGENMECPEIPGPPSNPVTGEPPGPEEGGNGENENDKNKGLTGVEIGAIVVVLIVVGAVIGVIVYCCRKKENSDLALVHAPLPGQQLSVMQRNVTPTMSSAQFVSGQGSGQVLQPGQNGSVVAGGASAPNPNPGAASSPVATPPPP